MAYLPEDMARDRRLLGFTQDGLAKRLGTSRSWVNGHETGKFTMSPLVIAAMKGLLAERLETSNDEMLGLMRRFLAFEAYERNGAAITKRNQANPLSTRKRAMAAITAD